MVQETIIRLSKAYDELKTLFEVTFLSSISLLSLSLLLSFFPSISHSFFLSEMPFLNEGSLIIIYSLSSGNRFQFTFTITWVIASSIKWWNRWWPSDLRWWPGKRWRNGRRRNGSGFERHSCRSWSVTIHSLWSSHGRCLTVLFCFTTEWRRRMKREEEERRRMRKEGRI